MDPVVHIPVLPGEVMRYLAPAAGEIFVDGTIGLGGHAALLAGKLGPSGTLLGIDLDASALAKAGENLSSFPGCLILRHGNYRDLPIFLEEEGLPAPDGILLDLGVSSLQLDRGERGFSYWEDAPLDMRMDSTQGFTAADLVNGASREELCRIIREYGEEPWAARISKFIVEERRKNPILTTYHLVQVIKAAVPAGARRRGPHPARRTFQALRIAVNKELESLAAGLAAGIRCLAPGGRMVVISFHSLEDRLVKQTFQRMARKCTCPPGFPVCCCGGGPGVEILTNRPVTPSAGEIAANPRARSAKLRAIRKL
jgi:16S rRNA (cytosine1402-N4)-methyltransferase